MAVVHDGGRWYYSRQLSKSLIRLDGVALRMLSFNLMSAYQDYSSTVCMAARTPQYTIDSEDSQNSPHLSKTFIPSKAGFKHDVCLSLMPSYKTKQTSMYGRHSSNNFFNSNQHPPLSVPTIRRRVLCLYCHRTHLKSDMHNGVCPQLKEQATELQHSVAFPCTACEGEGRFEQQVETRLLESDQKYEARWKQWMEDGGSSDPTALPPQRKVFSCQKNRTEVVCSECRGEGKILRMQSERLDNHPLPRMTVNPTWAKHRMQPTPAEGQIHCAICLVQAQPDEGNFQLSCTHQFHAGCIFRWLKQNEKCPICRSVDPFLDLAQLPRQPSLIREEEDEMDSSRRLYMQMVREGVPVRPQQMYGRGQLQPNMAISQGEDSGDWGR